MLNENGAPLVAVGGKTGPRLGEPLVGSEPSVVYHNCAPTVASVTWKEAALSPRILGVAAWNTNRLEAIELFGRLGAYPIALTVMSE